MEARARYDRAHARRVARPGRRGPAGRSREGGCGAARAVDAHEGHRRGVRADDHVRSTVHRVTVSFGIQLPIQAQSTIFVEEWEKTAGADELAAIARACDRAGFLYVAVCDHVAIPRARADAMSTTWYDPIATLGWLAGVTERVRLLSHVFVAAYRHPLQTAKAFATLDALSNGRAILGVGAGHVEEEFDALGVSFADRGRLTDAAIDQIRAALRDEWGSGDLGQRPRPVQADGPPIWIGGSTGPAIRRAARRGDGWLPQGVPREGMRSAIERLHELRAEAGRT